MHTEVLALLNQFAEEKYRAFTAKLLPPKTAILGVRASNLRKIIKQLVKEQKAATYLQLPPHELQYQEEFEIYACLLAEIKQDYSTKLEQIKSFVPHIKNWGVCDSFCAALKEIKKNPAKWYADFLPYTESGLEYQIRFFYVLALEYFIIPELLPTLLNRISTQKYVGYYDKMAVAWFLSVAYVKFPVEIEDFIHKTPLDTFVFRKTISKICDSFRVNKEAKVRLRTFASSQK